MEKMSERALEYDEDERLIYFVWKFEFLIQGYSENVLLHWWEHENHHQPTVQQICSLFIVIWGGGNPSVNTYKLSKFSDFFSWNFSHGS